MISFRPTRESFKYTESNAKPVDPRCIAVGFGTVTHRGAGTDRGAKLLGPLPGAVGAAACSCGLYTFGQGQETAASARLVRESIRYRASAPVSPTAAWEKTAPASGHLGLWFGAAHERTRGGPQSPVPVRIRGSGQGSPTPIRPFCSLPLLTPGPGHCGLERVSSNAAAHLGTKEDELAWARSRGEK